MEKLLITCKGDGPLRSYVSKHHNFEESFPGEFESIHSVDAYAAISRLISQFRPRTVLIMRHDSRLVELFVIEE